MLDLMLTIVIIVLSQLILIPIIAFIGIKLKLISQIEWVSPFSFISAKHNIYIIRNYVNVDLTIFEADAKSIGDQLYIHESHLNLDYKKDENNGDFVAIDDEIRKLTMSIAQDWRN